jgi:adenosylhomocysteine nucleosidase
MKVVALIAAMPQEIAPFLHRLGRPEPYRLGILTAYRFHLFDLDCVLVRSGVGLQRAITASRALIQAVRPELLVSFGVAGAFLPGLRVGDVVAVERASLLEDAAAIETYLPLAQMSPLAQQAVSDALQPLHARFYPGAILTTRGSQVVPPLPAGVLYPVLDMETAGIAQVAAAEGAVPLLALRAVSDSVDQPLPFDLAGLYDEQQNLRVRRIVAVMIRNPGKLAQSIRVSQNVNRASRNLAVALFEALKHTGELY